MTSSTTSRGIEPTVNSSVFAAFSAGITTIVLALGLALASRPSAWGTVSGTVGLHVDGAAPPEPSFGEGADGGHRQGHGRGRQREGPPRRRERCLPRRGPADGVIEVGVGREAAHEAVEPAEYDLPATQVADPGGLEPQLAQSGEQNRG